MSVIIDDTCITCDACLQNCPVNAIVDDMSNPTGENRYYVQPEKCIECVGVFDDPQCAAICPSIGCITWDKAYTKENTLYFTNSDLYVISKTKNGVLKSPELREKKYRDDIPDSKRATGELVQVEPDDSEVG